MDPEKHVFSNWGKFQKVKTFTQYLKFTAKHNFVNQISTILLKTVIYIQFYLSFKSCYKNPAYGSH